LPVKRNTKDRSQFLSLGQDAAAAIYSTETGLGVAETFKYRAFISYSHADKEWADWLHKALERYRVPRGLAGAATSGGAIPARLYPVYRDREESATASDLHSAIKVALAQSANLIVICSPAAGRSRWVNEEIVEFRALGRGGRIHAFIVDGEPNAADAQRECFPPVMRHGAEAQSREPAAADARRHGDGRENAKLKLIAGLLDVAYDGLRERDRKAVRARRWGYAAIVATFAITALAALFAFIAWQIGNSRTFAHEANAAYESGDDAQAIELAAMGLPTAKGTLFDLSSDDALAAASRALNRYQGLYRVAGTGGEYAVSADGRALVTRTISGYTLLDARTGRQLVLSLGYGLTIGTVATRSRMVAGVNGDGAVGIARAGQPTARRVDYRSASERDGIGSADHEKPSNLRFSLDERRLLFIDNNVLVLSDSGTGKTLAISPPFGEKPLWVGFSAGDKQVIAITKSGSWLWQAGAAPVALAAFDGLSIKTFPHTSVSETAIAFSNGEARLIDVRSGRSADFFVDRQTVAIDDAGGGQLVALNTDGMVTVSDRSGSPLRRFAVGRQPNDAFAAIGGTRVLTSADGAIAVWDDSGGADLGILKGLDGPLVAVDFYGRRAVTFSKSGIERLWDIPARRSVAVLNTLAQSSLRADYWRWNEKDSGTALSHDGHWLIGTSMAGTVKIWNAGTGMETAALPFAGADQVWISADGRLAATADEVSEPAIWDVALRRTVGHIQFPGTPKTEPFKDGRTFPVYGRAQLAISPSGRFAAASCELCSPGGIDLYSLPSGRRLGHAVDGEAAILGFEGDDDLRIRAGGRILHFDHLGTLKLAADAFDDSDPFRRITYSDDHWALIGPFTKLPIAFFDPFDFKRMSIKPDPVISGNLALMPMENGDLHLWRAPHAMSARQIARRICQGVGNTVPASCFRPGLADLDAWQRLLRAGVLGFLLSLVCSFPHFLLSVLVWRASPARLALRAVLLACVFPLCAWEFGSNATVGIWLASSFFAILGLAFFGLRRGIRFLRRGPA
jgi:WD40 repeat protein